MMNSESQDSRRRLKPLLLLAALFLALTFSLMQKQTVDGSTDATYTRSSYQLPGGHVQFGSPTLADLDNDGVPEVLVGTIATSCSPGDFNCSHSAPTVLVAMKGDGTILWSRDVGAPINSTPAVGNLNNDPQGNVEIVVTTGGDTEDRGQTGKVMAFDRNGGRLWEFDTVDFYPQDGYGDGGFGSPSLCDVDNDQDLEIAFGSWDQRIYLFDHEGHPLWQNMPNDFPGTGYHNADTVWSTPACADLNGDGDDEIVIGADIAKGGILPDGTEPEDGGYLYVFEGDGTVLVRRYIPEAIYAAPAVGDLDGDGTLEIVSGTSFTHWLKHGRTDQPYVYAFSTHELFGSRHYSDPQKLPFLPGWPQPTDYPGFSSPALADLDQDGDLEIVIGTSHPDLANDAAPGAGRVHAWHHTGQPVAGWPISPKDNLNKDAQIYSSPTIADVDADGQLEILFAMLWDVQIYNADGSHQNTLQTKWTLASSPTVGDTDGDGQVDIWIGGSNHEAPQSGYLWHFEGDQAGLGAQPWPMFHRDSANRGTIVPEGEPYKWTYRPPGEPCADEARCGRSSPVLADLDGDGRPEIIAATDNGYVVATRNDGSVLWEQDLADDFGMAAGTQEIASSPAVADIDSDGLPEIVVGAGTIDPNHCTQGGLVVLEHTGKVAAGWPYLSHDSDGDNCRDTIFSTPAIANLDDNNDMEIIAGGFDGRIYAWHHDGTLVEGYPPDSYLRNWHNAPELEGQLASEIWGSPAVAFLDDDLVPEIVITTNEGLYEGDDDWACPYIPPPGYPSDYCGGSLYVLNADGSIRENFPIHVPETLESSPAVLDIDGDGDQEIFAGTGSFYYQNSPDRPTAGFRFFGWDHEGNPLPGWEGGVEVQGSVPASPSVGDITGDGIAEIVVATSVPEQRLYAWQQNGDLVPGFPRRPTDHTGQTPSSFEAGTGFVLADTDGDPAMEIILGVGNEVVIVNGDGSQLTRSPQTTAPIYRASGFLGNTPLVGDLDGDGHLELVAQGDRLVVWDLPGASGVAEWPAFKKTATRVSTIPVAQLGVAPGTLAERVPVSVLEKASYVEIPIQLANVGNTSVLEWQITATEPASVELLPASGQGTDTTVMIRVSTDRLVGGENRLGSLQISASTRDGSPLINSSVTVPFTVTVVENGFIYLPLIIR